MVSSLSLEIEQLLLFGHVVGGYHAGLATAHGVENRKEPSPSASSKAKTAIFPVVILEFELRWFDQERILSFFLADSMTRDMFSVGIIPIEVYVFAL